MKQIIMVTKYNTVYENGAFCFPNYTTLQIIRRAFLFKRYTKYKKTMIFTHLHV